MSDGIPVAYDSEAGQRMIREWIKKACALHRLLFHLSSFDQQLSLAIDTLSDEDVDINYIKLLRTNLRRMKTKALNAARMETPSVKKD